MEADGNPSLELLERMEGMREDGILWCWGEEMGLCLRRSGAFPPSRAWLSAHSTDSCLSSDPTAFVPVFRTPGRAHRAQVHIRAPLCIFSPFPEGMIHLRGMEPAQLYPGQFCAVTLNLSGSSRHRDCSVRRKVLLPLSSCLWFCLKIALNI